MGALGAVLVAVLLLGAVAAPVALAQPASIGPDRTSSERVELNHAKSAPAAPAARQAEAATPRSAKALKPAPPASAAKKGEEIGDRARKLLLILLGSQRSSDAR